MVSTKIGLIQTKNVFFNIRVYVTCLVCRAVRVIRQPRGNMLVMGIGGSGRQSLSKLASYICLYNVFQIEVSKNYRRGEFREGLYKGIKCSSIFESLPI